MEDATHRLSNSSEAMNVRPATNSSLLCLVRPDTKNRTETGVNREHLTGTVQLRGWDDVCAKLVRQRSITGTNWIFPAASVAGQAIRQLFLTTPLFYRFWNEFSKTIYAPVIFFFTFNFFLIKIWQADKTNFMYTYLSCVRINIHKYKALAITLRLI
jgi:hypothetical protein